MKLWGIFRFEFGYQIRRGWPWAFFAVILAICFLMSRDRALADAMYEDFFANSPFVIALTTVFGGLMWLLAAPAIAGEAGARDVATRMYPLVYTSSVSKAEYLGGRFLAALALNALILLAAPTGILLAVNSPGLAPETLGPLRPASYLTAYAFLALPNALVATALQFALAERSGRTMAGYAGSLVLVFMGFFVASLLLYNRGLGTLLDPIGIRFVVEDIAHLWTPIEKNTRLVGLEGVVLQNRLVWIGVAFATMAVTFRRFRFAHRVESSWWKRRARRGDAAAPTPAVTGITARIAVAAPQAAQAFGLAMQLRQTLAIAWTSFRTLATSWTGLALLTFIPLMTILVVIDQLSAVGAPLVPLTSQVLRELTAPLGAELSRWVIIPLLIVFFAGELAWRERDAGVGEITGAMPGSEWAPFLGKFLGLALVLALFTTLQMAAGIVAQTTQGYGNYEIGLYLKVLFGFQLPDYLLFALLALVIQVLVNQKYVGHLVAIMAFAFISVLASMLGVEHNLLVYGAGPAWSYTEMRGFGPSVGPWLWFKLYWTAWALLLAVMARLLWIRGAGAGWRARLEIARQRFTGLTTVIGVGAVALVLSVGGFIFYNTNVLNAYFSSAARKERSAEYERRYGRYENIAQPGIAGVSLRVEIYPERRAADIRGSYRLLNGSAVPIDSIHLVTATGVDTRAVTLNRPSTLAVNDEKFGYRIYKLGQPLQPGDTLRLDFEVGVARHGFGNRGADPSITATGSAFGAAWFPLVGYQRRLELLTASDRREYGLRPRPVIASLSDSDEGEPPSRGGGIAFEAVVGTDEGQVAVAPGALRRTWTERGRRYFDYATSAPIGSEWSFFSANYAVRSERWNDVAIQIFHDPRHTAHLDRTVRSVRASMEYYSAQFGPYPYRHLSVVETPGAPGTGLHADASMISHGEGFPFWIPKDEGSFDFPYAVVGHEMGHQWGVPYAIVEGAPFLSEGLAWYSAMQMVKATRGNAQFQRLVSFMREPSPYREIRRGAPLLRALDPYMSYRRGPFAMYAMSEYIGADRVNGAIRRLLAKHDSAGVPLATTLDLYRELEAATPDSLQYLLHDLFEVNTYWDVETERATATQNADSTWNVTLDVRAKKSVIDSAGVQTEVPMNDEVEIGVFAADDNASAQPLYLARHRIRSGTGTITVTVPRKPGRAGVDPNYLLSPMNTDDNITSVTIPSSPPRSRSR